MRVCDLCKNTAVEATPYALVFTRNAVGRLSTGELMKNDLCPGCFHLTDSVVKNALARARQYVRFDGVPPGQVDVEACVSGLGGSSLSPGAPVGAQASRQETEGVSSDPDI